jgi:uncharacterized Zn-finger protein
MGRPSKNASGSYLLSVELLPLYCSECSMPVMLPRAFADQAVQASREVHCPLGHRFVPVIVEPGKEVVNA